MVVEKLPEVNPPSGRVPGQGLLAAPILKRRRQQNREGIAKKGFSPIPSLFRRRRRFKIGAARRRCPGTLPEGGFTFGSFSNAIHASRMSHEYSTLDHGSTTSSYVMFSLLPCALLLILRELPYMIEAHM